VTPVVIPGLSPAATAPGNRLLVDACCRVAGEENVFAIGDMAAMTSGQLPKGHPMLAPVAMQQGTHLGKNFRRLLRNEPLKPFKYRDKGTMATIGRMRAVADLPFAHFAGFAAWLSWMAVHLFYLVGFRNKLFVLVDWTWNYFTYERGARLIIKLKPARETAAPPAVVPPAPPPEPTQAGAAAPLRGHPRALAGEGVSAAALCPNP
jgi:NADH dehydrogenase